MANPKPPKPPEECEHEWRVHKFNGGLEDFFYCVYCRTITQCHVGDPPKPQ